MLSLIKQVDELASPEECEALRDFYDRTSWLDGLGTDYQGQNVVYTTDLYNFAGIDREEYELVIEIKKRMRGIAQEIWAPMPVYIESGNLNIFKVGSSMGEHADNEQPTGPGGSWVPNHSPWREFFSILYLNDNFGGGETYWPKLGLRVKPRVGTAIFSPANRYYTHEVKKVKYFDRYAFAQWYTSVQKNCEVFPLSKDNQKTVTTI